MADTASRPVERVISSQPTAAGTLAVRRALPAAGRRSVGPWVFLDHFGPFPVAEGDEGVGPHPHAGIETVTYLLSGRNEHRDSEGHEGIVTAGGAQWMTAGRGIVHSERPLADRSGETVQHGLQLWISLPRSLKMMPPRYRALDAASIALARLPGARVRVIAGEVAGATGPAQTLMPVFLAHVSLDSGAAVALEVAACHEAAAYVIDGAGTFGPGGEVKADGGKLVIFANEGGALAVTNMGDGALELMMLGGAPAEGPLVFHGPFVMNSLEQARAADAAFRSGRMGSLRQPSRGKGYRADSSSAPPARTDHSSHERPQTMTDILFAPIALGGLTLKNRIVMAPMTRSRAIGNVPNALMESYYASRADAGLLITEGTSPSPDGLGYARIPGVFSDEQVKGWKRVTDGVHRAGGTIFVQLMHTGRVGHPANLPAGARIVAPSAIAAPGEMWTDSGGQQPHPEPVAMGEPDIAHAISEFATAAKRAVEAGFDGVELHAANGYLIDQFLNTASNRRTDRWGGGLENRIRFAVEVARASAAAIGAHRVGMRISPYGVFNGMAPDAGMDAMYLRLMDELNALGLVYIHVVDHSSMGAPEVSPALKAGIRAAFKGRYILSGGYDAARARADLDGKAGDLVAFGRAFIANPDLVRKQRDGVSPASPDPDTFYSPGERGYTDYPVAVSA